MPESAVSHARITVSLVARSSSVRSLAAPVHYRLEVGTAVRLVSAATPACMGGESPIDRPRPARRLAGGLDRTADNRGGSAPSPPEAGRTPARARPMEAACG